MAVFTIVGAMLWRLPPCMFRDEVEKAGTEGQELAPISGVFHQNELAICSQNACDFSKRISLVNRGGATRVQQR